MGCFIPNGAMQIKPCKQQRIKPHSQGFFQFRVRHPMPLADQQTFNQNNLIISLGAQNNPEDPHLIGLNRFQKRQNQRPIHKHINFAQDILIPNPTRALMHENLYENRNVDFQSV
jgi:hypothetical protein